MDLLDGARDESSIVLVDDLHLLTAAVEAGDYPRGNLLYAVMSAALDDANACNRKLVFAALASMSR